MFEQEVAFYKIKPSDVIHINEVIITTMPVIYLIVSFSHTEFYLGFTQLKLP